MRYGAPIAVGVAVAASTLIRFAAAGRFDVPWIVPDEATYGMLGASLWETGSLALRGAAAPFYSLTTPALVGLPLAIDWSEGAVRAAQLLQALAMSLAAVPVYLWARRLVSPALSVATAVLALLVPHFVYAATLMTEPLAYLLVTAALLALARMLERPTLGAQALLMLFVTAAVATRLQALVLVPTVVAAALLDAWLARSRRGLRRLAPLLACLVAASAVGVIVSLTGAGSVAGVYSESAGDAAGLQALPREMLWHAAALLVGAAGLAVLAAAMLLWLGVRRGEPDAPVRALLAATGAYVVLLTVQVSAFAAGHLEAAAGRYLVTAYPPLLLCLAVWVARGAPRQRPVAAGMGLAVVGLLVLAPLDRIAPSTALQDTPGTVALGRLADLVDAGQAAMVVAGVVAVGVFLFLPTRAAPLALVLTAVAFATASTLAWRDLSALSRKARADDVVEAPLDWVDRAGGTRVTLLDSGARDAASLARTVFWNRSVVDAVRLPTATGGLPLVSSPATIGVDGYVRAGERSLPGGEILAPATLVLDGEAVAGSEPSDAGPGLTLWRADSPLRAVLERAAFSPNGDFVGAARVRVFACGRGTLAVTLLGKAPALVRAFVDGIPVRELRVAPGTTTRLELPAPPYAEGGRDCVFDLESDALVGSTTVAWEPEPR